MLLDLGFEEHIRFPPAVHPFLSICDQAVNRDGKVSWRGSGVNLADNGASTIQFILYFDRAVTSRSKSDFDRIIFDMTEENALKHVKQGGGSTLSEQKEAP